MIKVMGSSQEVTGYKKYLDFEYEGKRYGVVLYWDVWDGYELWFKSESETPLWAQEWEDKHEESLGLTLDQLSDELVEGESK